MLKDFLRAMGFLLGGEFRHVGNEFHPRIYRPAWGGTFVFIQPQRVSERASLATLANTNLLCATAKSPIQWPLTPPRTLPLLRPRK
jgi:hypothetical protein